MTLKTIVIVLTTFALECSVTAQTSRPPATAAPKAAAKYGSNSAAGKTLLRDGVKLYYEVYGTGEPVLIVHGNGGSIFDVGAQIDHFRKRYRVIAMDSRDHGRSSDSPDTITYEKMTDDLAALLDHLKTGPVYVLGWSDGGIEGLLLGIRHPAKVKKIAAMAANLNPSDKALHPEAVAFIKSAMAEMSAQPKNIPASRREAKVTQMMLDEPNIDPKALESIAAPTLVLASDNDVIADEHTLEIYHRIPNSQLCIFPGATHMIPFDDPVRFNAAVERFFRAPFVKKDRIKDFLKSLEALKASR
jgi:pimeloyl-ACP methyl ester carboxylesterase